jgi:hypothetical protein
MPGTNNVLVEGNVESAIFKTELHKNVYYLAKLSIRRDLHKDSSCFIHWISAVGKYGIASTNKFSHKDEEMLDEDLKRLISSASEDDLCLWSKKLQQ